MPPGKQAGKKVGTIRKIQVSQPDKKTLATTLDGKLLPAMVMAELRKALGKSAGHDIILIDDYTKQDPICGWVRTGSFGLDCAIGFPNDYGIPLPSIIEIVGKTQTLKSIVACQILGNIQRMGGWSELVDVEDTFTPDYAKLARLSTAPDKFGYSQAQLLEDALTIMENSSNLSHQLAPGVPFGIALDNVASTTTKEEMETEGTPSRAAHARILSRRLRSGIANGLYDRETEKGVEKKIGRPVVIIIVNKLISTMPTAPYMTPYDSFGGDAIKYWSRVRIQIEKSEDLKEDGASDVDGIRVRFKIIKNKVARPLRVVEADFRFDTGMEDYIPIIEFIDRNNAFEKSGNLFVWQGKKYYKYALREHLICHPDSWEAMCQKALKVMETAWSDKRFVPSPVPAAGGKKNLLVPKKKTIVVPD